jgi:Flp pilus assembly protein TadG
LGTRTWRIPQRLRRQRDDEHGAEMVEFAVVVVLLIALLYGIITYGLILAAQATITQAAADAARSGIVISPSAAEPTGCTTTATTDVAIICTAEAQAATDVGWMNKGACNESSPTITCVATVLTCPSNANATCLKVTVSYNYGSSPLFPEMPGLGIFTPSTLSSTNVLQLSTPSS